MLVFLSHSSVEIREVLLLVLDWDCLSLRYDDPFIEPGTMWQARRGRRAVAGHFELFSKILRIMVFMRRWVSSVRRFPRPDVGVGSNEEASDATIN